MFLAKDKNPNVSIQLNISFLHVAKATSFCYTRNLHVITIAKFVLSSISNGLLFWSVNQTLISLYSELNVFKMIWFVS